MRIATLQLANPVILAPMARVGAEPKGTTTISCVDADGLVVSVTHTLGVPSGVVVPGLGFMLNGAMNWYDPRPGRPTSYAPGKRRYSSMSPLIASLTASRPTANASFASFSETTPGNDRCK